MNERDRMLAEGPRVAPEPPTADGFAPIDSPAPPASPAPTARTSRNAQVPRGLLRLLPIGIFALVLAANAGAGKYAIWVIVPVAIAATVIQHVRKGRK
jgi:hypothetical protein